MMQVLCSLVNVWHILNHDVILTYSDLPIQSSIFGGGIYFASTTSGLRYFAAGTWRNPAREGEKPRTTIRSSDEGFPGCGFSGLAWRFGIDGVPDPKEIDRPVILAALSCLHRVTVPANLAGPSGT